MNEKKLESERLKTKVVKCAGKKGEKCLNEHWIWSLWRRGEREGRVAHK